MGVLLRVLTHSGIRPFCWWDFMDRGWVKLWRKTIDSGILRHGRTLQVFIWILIHAAHKEENRSTRYGIVKIKPGEVLIGREQLAKVLKLTSQNIRTSLKLLKSTGVITIEPTNAFSVITLVKWVDYQGQPHKVTSELTSELTSSQPAANQQLTTEQEVKHLRIKEQPSIRPDFETFYQNYPRHEAKQDARKAWDQTEKIRPSLEAILKNIEGRRNSEAWTKEGGKYCPLPASYLRGHRWEDEVNPDAGKTEDEKLQAKLDAANKAQKERAGIK